MNRLKILIANDDGIDAPGIRILAKRLSQIADIVVAAPNTERSCFSHAISLHGTISVTPTEFDGIEAYAISGTPADCVKLALVKLVDECDLVVSGINRGSNIGTDIMYSGTVAAAMEGAFLGKKAIAISQADFGGRLEYYHGAAEFLAKNLMVFYNTPLDTHTMININYPAVEYARVKGVKLAHMGLLDYADEYEVVGDEYAWTGCSATPKNREGNDVDYIRNGYITVTPLAIDMTHYKTLQRWQEQKLELVK